jgi:uncharacterized protein (TIGR00369 family)
MAEPVDAPWNSGWAGHLGLEIRGYDDKQVRARVAVRDELKQAAGIVDGGVYATIAENICSWATHVVAMRDGRHALGLSNHTSFLRPVGDGHVDATARARHRGSTTWVWEVEFLDAQGRLCALSRVTVAVR